MTPELAHFEVSGRRIAYRSRKGAGPTLLFLPGYASDMEGAKALALDAFAERRGLAMLRFDYSGTGSSAGRFEDGALTSWLEECLALVDGLSDGPLILLGSSMGGWLALHVALSRPARIQAVVLIAGAADFTDWGFADAEDAERRGLTTSFYQSGQQLRLLDGQIGIDCPVRLIHGECDNEVPLDVAFRTLRALRSADVQLKVIKGGGHRLSGPIEIDAILRTVAGLLEPAL